MYRLDHEKYPLVSIIVRTVDRPYYLRECLTSLIIQDYPNIEIIIVNDGGPSVSNLITDMNLRYPYQLIENDHNQGRSSSGNIGIKASRGQYIGFIDDDDIFYPFHISTLIEALRNSNYKVAYSDALQATQIKCHFNRNAYSTIDLASILSVDFDLKDLLTRNYIPILCAIFEKSCLKDGLEFDTKIEVLEDWDFWIGIAKNYDFLHVREITCEYRYRADGSNTVGQLDDLWNWSRTYLKEKHCLP